MCTQLTLLSAEPSEYIERFKADIVAHRLERLRKTLWLVLTIVLVNNFSHKSPHKGEQTEEQAVNKKKKVR